MGKNIISKRLKEARNKQNPKVTQTDLLARLEIEGISLNETAISKIEAGTRPVTDIELVAIAKVLKVNILWLLEKEF